MDLELARTFLEVAGTGSFVAAAHRLNVTQSTVSTRIHVLEQQLGSRLFVRNKGGAVLTPTGVQFQRHAAALLRIWQRARQELAMPAGYRALLRIGGEAGLWNWWLHLWVRWMRHNAADIALRCEVGLSDGLTHGLLDGLLDIAVMYSPQSRPGLVIELLAEEQLVLLEAAGPAGAGGRDEQVYVDWGEEFRRKHRMTFPDFPSPALFIGLGTLGFDYLLHNGGTGYFPRSLAQPHLASGAVRIVPDTRTFPLSLYAVHADAAALQIVGPAIAGLREVLTTAISHVAGEITPHHSTSPA